MENNRTEYYRKYWAENKERLSANNKKRRDERREEHKRTRKQWQSNNPDKRLAHSRYHTAKLSGRVLKPQRCVICGTTHKIQSHHHFYQRPLEVVGLCATHHRRIHSNKHNNLTHAEFQKYTRYVQAFYECSAWNGPLKPSCAPLFSIAPESLPKTHITP